MGYMSALDIEISDRARARSPQDKDAILDTLWQMMDEIAVCGRTRDFGGLRRCMALIDAAFARLEQIENGGANGAAS